MYKYEITKYNPEFRSKRDGRTYLKDEWTAISDIGRSFEGIILKSEEYKKAEDSYVASVQIIMKYMKINYIVVDDIRRSSKEFFNNQIKNRMSFYSEKLLALYNDVQNKDKLDMTKTSDFCRLQLREDIGADMFYPRRLKIFIGYDYIMSVHTSISLTKIIPKIEELNLFVEEF